ncbi:MarR family winged helix-turn-helix transcriptional regulator [Amycolatopsis sp. OK19-0408]|uniref:MarR family winged helix-turn-helix transcriptional regulator n=1 Tax=Amycolatopsis iheyensis TaxID=2945988 RepID=A0A9X2NMS1_9PSEU|nr:MarR family winged helix-turn-helix transcriptional regulator [Amycolatopsis iheyensis]MCR6489257.1 MarR family winged helix-turn-helix transcriptional regulator [Amycolatopsis iheyensis]
MLEPAEWEFWDTWMRAQRLLVRELDRGLQRDCGISKAEFSVLVRLVRLGEPMRVGELADALDWEKSRVSHLLTRMENRGLVARIEDGAGGRRTGIELTAEGRRAARAAIHAHGGNLRRLVFDRLTPEQRAAIGAWNEDVVGRLDR